MMSSRKQKKLLRDVSRSFYLTLRVLPSEIRPQISLAYLLARASDTIADTDAVPRVERVALLQAFRNAIRQKAGDSGAVTGNFAIDVVTKEAATRGERTLLKQMDSCLETLATFEDFDRIQIAELLDTIIAGQIFDLEKFPGTNETGVVSLADDEELDRYTYMVAGCVGEFWTKLCLAHIRDLHHWDAAPMTALGVRFGKGLQMINILRDMARDLNRGRCYLPVPNPEDLLTPSNFAQIRDLYQSYLDQAVSHLEAAWLYTMQIPRTQIGLRLACIWPIWIGLGTLARLRHANPLDLAMHVKISRWQVYRILLRSWLFRRNSHRLQRYHRKIHHRALGIEHPHRHHEHSASDSRKSERHRRKHSHSHPPHGSTAPVPSDPSKETLRFAEDDQP